MGEFELAVGQRIELLIFRVVELLSFGISVTSSLPDGKTDSESYPEVYSSNNSRIEFLKQNWFRYGHSAEL